MLARTTVLSLTLSCISSSVAALDLDVNNRDSIVATTKTLVNGIAIYYNESLSDSGTPGLFPKPYWWVEAGLFFNGLVEYANLTGDTQYDSLVSEALLFQAGVNYTYPFRPNSEYEVYNDHQCAWAQTAMTAAEVGFRKPNNGSWVGLSIDMFDVIASRWDVGLCDGGLTTAAYTFADRFYADMAANSNFFLLASRLARFTKNQTYSEWAEKVFDWSKDAGLLSENYVVFDGGRGKDNCTTIDHDAWTYMHGLFTEGTAVMYQNTGGKQKWADAVKGFVNSTTIFLEDGALAEIACEHNELCRSVERGFKGVAARSYARAAIAAPAVTEPLHKILETSAKAAARTCIQVGERNEETEDVRCASSWAGRFNESDAATARDGNLGEVLSAMETIQSLLYSSAKPSEPNVTDDSTDKNSTENGGAGTPEKAGGARTKAAGITAVLAVAFAAALMC